MIWLNVEHRNAILLGVGVAIGFIIIYVDLFLCRSTFTNDAIIWYGSFHYFVSTLSGGEFPFWDPYLTAGTYFYPNIPHHGLLDPAVLTGVGITRLFDISPLTIYTYLHIFRLITNVCGAFLLFRHLAKNILSGLLAASLLLLAMPHSYFKQYGVIDHIYLVPFALYLLLRFLEEPHAQRRWLWLAGLSIITGIHLNIYVPVHYFLNLLFILIGALLFKVADGREVLCAFGSRRFSLFAGLLLFFTLVMASPSFVMMVTDASSTGELFPMQRIVQKNDAKFKQIMATDIDTSNLSSRFTDNKAVFSSWGNLVNLIYPDLLKSFRYWAEKDYMSEIDQYFGIIPFVFSIVGIFIAPASIRWLLLLLLGVNLVSGYSTYGFYNHPFNFLQNLSHLVFPPLKMIQGRENFGYFVTFYLCAFSAIGFTTLFCPNKSLQGRWRVIIGACGMLILLKIVITWVFAGKPAVTSGYDIMVFLQIVLAIVTLILLSRGRFPRSFGTLVIVGVILTDLFYYNIIFRDDVLQRSEPFYRAFAVGDRPSGATNFDYFRVPLELVPLNGQYVAFEESITKTKGSLSLGYNHCLFTTKRYYDFLTHLSAANQFALNGTLYPILQFFPTGQTAQVLNRHEFLGFLASADLINMSSILAVEYPTNNTPMLQALSNFRQYPDVSWLKFDRIFSEIYRLETSYGERIQKERARLGEYLDNSKASIRVLDFKVNKVTFKVINKTDGYFFYNDGWSKYWQAFDNGQQIPILIGNYNGKAVYLQAGEHIVNFVFNPRPYKLALIGYFVSLIVLSGVFVLSWMLITKEYSHKDRR